MKATDFWRKEADKMRNTSNITDTSKVLDTGHLGVEKEDIKKIIINGVNEYQFYTQDGYYIGCLSDNSEKVAIIKQDYLVLSNVLFKEEGEKVTLNDYIELLAHITKKSLPTSPTLPSFEDIRVSNALKEFNFEEIKSKDKVMNHVVFVELAAWLIMKIV